MDPDVEACGLQLWGPKTAHPQSSLGCFGVWGPTCTWDSQGFTNNVQTVANVDSSTCSIQWMGHRIVRHQDSLLEGDLNNGDRVLGIEPTAELRERLKLQPNEVLQLLKGAYGRVDAPYLWFMELKRGLESLGFTASPFDPCTFVLVNPKTGTTEGVVGVHVDDGLCCGSKLFQEKLMALSKIFPFGSHKKRNFTFTGLRIDQQPDHSIHINQTQYVKDIHPIAIAKNRKMHPDEPVNESERQSLRGLIGSLQYAAVNTRPDLCSRLGNLQSQINKAKISTLNDCQ